MNASSIQYLIGNDYHTEFRDDKKQIHSLIPSPHTEQISNSDPT